MEGWLAQRGPKATSLWQQRWCVLLPASVEYFTDPTCTNKKGSISFLPQTHVVLSKGDGTLEDASSYVEERPFSFFLDVDPQEGKNGTIFYFDAQDAEVLERWTTAIEKLLSSLDSLQEGDAVIVNLTFMANSEENMRLETGAEGLVIGIDKDGAALIEFDDHAEAQWVHCNHFFMLSKQVETLPKEVVLELVPQDPFIMHWAIRVDTGPMSRCYEFENCGLKISRTTKLYKGFPIKRIKLRGHTFKSHRAIQNWATEFASQYEYSSYGDNALWGKNCQDFAVELCDFLGIDTSQLPWRQARVVKTVVGAGAGAFADLALGTGILAKIAELIGAGALAAVGITVGPEVLAVGAVCGAGALAAYGLGMVTLGRPSESP